MECFLSKERNKICAVVILPQANEHPFLSFQYSDYQISGGYPGLWGILLFLGGSGGVGWGKGIIFTSQYFHHQISQYGPGGVRMCRVVQLNPIREAVWPSV